MTHDPRERKLNPSVESARRSRSRRRRPGGGGRAPGPPPAYRPQHTQFPPPPEEPWSQDQVADFAKLRRKKDLHLSSLIPVLLPDLQKIARKEGIAEALGMSRHQVLRRLVATRMAKHGVFFTKGVLDILPDGNAFLRHDRNDYTPNPATDALLHAGLVQRHKLKQGQEVSGVLAPLREDDRFLVLHEILTVFGEEPARQLALPPFSDLVPLYPDQRLRLETDPEGIEMRIVDMISPIGKGQRGIIVAPPRTGKTVLLQMIANAIVTNHPECHLIILLVDERPEEVTDFDRTVGGETREIISSTFDEPPARHIKVAEMVTDRAKRMVEQGRDVVILLDSITRLARSYNNEAPANSKILSGGIVAEALQKPKRFFGAARNLENGGSLTILATALIDTNSKMDEVIFEEFKGTGNMELVLDRQLADRRVWPAIDINRSGTRKEDLLFTKEELQRVWLLRKVLNEMNSVEAMELLIERIRKSKDNADFLINLNVG